MKKSICVVLILLLLIAVAPSAMAAGTAYMSGPGTVRAGDTITVSFYAGGGIFGGSGSVSYDTSLLTLQGYNQAIGGSWVVEFSGNNFVFYDNSMSSPVSGAVIFTATFVVNASIGEGTAISVSANNVTLSDGKQDMAMGTCTYSATIAPPLSGNCRLGSLSVANASINPGFSPDVLTYSASVPFETAALSLTAAAEHGGATVYIDNPGLAVAGTTNIRITVTAENGASQTYTIQVFRAQDPNYVPSANADLKELRVVDYQLSPQFSPEVTRYYVWPPYETETISINASVADNRARFDIAQQTELTPGAGTDIPVTVTAEDGTQKVYTITAVRAPAHEDTDRFLNGEREEPPTEPVTEPTEAPTEAPTVPPTTIPATQPTEQPQPAEPTEEGLSLTIFILALVVCMLVGLALGVVVNHAAEKRRKQL